MNDADFAALTPSKKKAYLSDLVRRAMEVREDAYSASSRRGMTQGSAFLWVSVYGKSKVIQAFKRYVKANYRVINNYRGTPYAWYFGSTNDVGQYDALKAMCSFLNDNGITCFLCDEWD